MGILDFGGPTNKLNAPSHSAWAGSVAAALNGSDVTVDERITAALGDLPPHLVGTGYDLAGVWKTITSTTGWSEVSGAKAYTFTVTEPGRLVLAMTVGAELACAASASDTMHVAPKVTDGAGAQVFPIGIGNAGTNAYTRLRVYAGVSVSSSLAAVVSYDLTPAGGTYRLVPAANVIVGGINTTAKVAYLYFTFHFVPGAGPLPA